ncbi:MAG: Papain family cysteine protease, partial [Clostridia bacterium]|nr:Papain family cysteine protease [Clostridia bacterium]
VIVSIPWYKGAQVKDGILTTSSSEILGNHAVTLFGWKPEGWLFANSWGKEWGNSGCAILPYDYKFFEAWGVSDTITSQKIVKKPKNKFLLWVYGLLNKLANKKNSK